MAITASKKAPRKRDPEAVTKRDLIRLIERMFSLYGRQTNAITKIMKVLAARGDTLDPDAQQYLDQYRYEASAAMPRFTPGSKRLASRSCSGTTTTETRRIPALIWE